MGVSSLLCTPGDISILRQHYYVDETGLWKDHTSFIGGLYSVIKANQTVVAALVATLGVAWSWFFQKSFEASTPPEREQHEVIGLEVRESQDLESGRVIDSSTPAS
jgi:hypothetical protein